MNQQKYIPQEGKGTLFQNDKEWVDENPNRPHISGEMMINGTLMKVSGWYRTTRKDGSPCKPHFSIDAKPAEQVHNNGMNQARQAMQQPQQGYQQQNQFYQGQQQKQQPQQQGGYYNDDIPFG